MVAAFELSLLRGFRSEVEASRWEQEAAGGREGTFLLLQLLEGNFKDTLLNPKIKEIFPAQITIGEVIDNYLENQILAYLDSPSEDQTER
ncbi:tetratricopeptide repeat protein 27-like [Rhincodon typus]|uniref:tetratricopeptide repeat protein 27-like n=1 Tax=Rhincodon typus TaxID=259920 RepID=UPI0020305B73|nr:tetratricopeptide repeat protein 27-like [Rhincodon typus]